MSEPRASVFQGTKCVLLIVVSLIAGCVAVFPLAVEYVFDRSRLLSADEEAVQKWVGEKGGSVTLSGDKRHIIGIDLFRTDVAGEELKKLVGLPRLETLCLADTGVGDRDVKVLNSLVGLRELDLQGTRITWDGFQSLQNPTLEIVRTVYDMDTKDDQRIGREQQETR